MLVHELTARFDLDKISAQGVFAPWVRMKRHNKKGRALCKKDENGLTSNQKQILDYVAENQPCTSTEISNNTDVENRAVKITSRPLIKRNLIAQDEKTLMWYLPYGLHIVIQKKTKKQRLVNYIKKHGSVRLRDVQHITKCAHVYLCHLRDEGLLERASGNRWQWVG